MKFIPDYFGRINEQMEKVTIVRHLPELPVAVSDFQNDIFFNQVDSCFYRCTQIDAKWTWQKVTHGVRQNFMIPVMFLLSDTLPNDMIDTMNDIIREFAFRYKIMFNPMKTVPTGTELLAVCNKFNEIAKFINTQWDINIPLADTSESDPDSFEEFAEKFNTLVYVINPLAIQMTLIKDISDKDPSISPTEFIAFIVNRAKDLMSKLTLNKDL